MDHLHVFLQLFVFFKGVLDGNVDNRLGLCRNPGICARVGALPPLDVRVLVPQPP